MKRLGTWALVLVIAIVGGSLASNLGPIKDLYDSLFNRQTVVATGDVVLKRLKEQKRLIAATGSFEVPVVVCNGTPKAYDLQADPDKEGGTPAQQLLEACGGFLEAKATLLANAEVDAIIELGQLQDDDIVISGKKVTVRLPSVELAEPRVDAEDGLSVIGKEGSVPLIGGELPEDYQARAAAAAKVSIGRAAGQSELIDMGARSARSLFESLLTALGFTDVEVVVKESPASRQ